MSERSGGWAIGPDGCRFVPHTKLQIRQRKAWERLLAERDRFAKLVDADPHPPRREHLRRWLLRMNTCLDGIEQSL